LEDPRVFRRAEQERAQPDLRPDGDLTLGAGALKLGGTRAPRGRNRNSAWRLTRKRHQSPCSGRRSDGRRIS